MTGSGVVPIKQVGVRVAACVLASQIGGLSADADTERFCEALLKIAGSETVVEGDIEHRLPFPGNLPAPAFCDLAAGELGSQISFCRWDYSYRDGEARRIAGELRDRVGDCVGAPAITESPVNHPDSHDVKTFALDRAVVVVAVKDKAATGRSHVFFRVETGAQRAAGAPD